MTKKQIQNLVQASYIKDQLDAKTVEKIANLLSRQNLKEYLRGLTLAEKAKTVSLVLPSISVYNKKEFEKLFPKKQIKVEEDPSLLLGLKVIDNDMVYDFSLKNSLENFEKEVEQG